MFYKAIIGPKRQDAYLRRFLAFDAQGNTFATWHWPALFLTLYWLIYRKMWLNAVLYLVVPSVVMMVINIGLTLCGAPLGLMNTISVLSMVALYLLPAMYAHALYYRHCQKKIARARASGTAVRRQLGELGDKGGTSAVVVGVIAILSFVAIVGILAAIAIPAYQDYVTRARVAGALVVADDAAAAVGRYFVAHQQLPDSLAAAGLAPPPLPGVQSLQFDNKSGTLNLVMGAGPIVGQHLSLVPSLDADKHVVWTCASTEIRDKFLPLQCRRAH